MRFRVVLVASLATLIWCLAAAAQTNETQPNSITSDPLQSILSALSAYDYIELQATIETVAREAGNDNNPATYETTSVINIKRSRSQSMVSVKDTTKRPGAELWQAQYDAIADANNDVYEFQCNLDDSLHQIDGETGLGVALRSNRISRKKLVDRATSSASICISALNDSGAAVWIIGYASLSDYLRGTASVSVTTEGTLTKIIARSDYGELTLLASEVSGWLPESFELVKLPEHETIGGQVNKVYKGAVKAVKWSGKASEFSKDSSGHWAPSRITVMRRTQWSDQSDQIVSTDIRIDRVVFDPPLEASDFKSSIVIPSGFPVNIVGAQHLPYIWNGEQAVPKNIEFGTPPDAADFAQSSRKQGNQFVLALNIGVLLAIAIVLWIRSRSRHVRS